MKDFRVNGVSPGEGSVKLTSTDKTSVTARVVFAAETRTTVAQGTLVPPAGLSLIGDNRLRSDEAFNVGKSLVLVRRLAAC